MKIAIAADSHDNLATIKKFADFCNKSNTAIVIHCGDICGKEVLESFLRQFFGKIYISLGNADFKDQLLKIQAKNQNRVFIFEKSGNISAGGLKMSFCHFEKDARRIASLKKDDLVFFGHTHKPHIEEKEKVVFANPGNLAGLFYKATFAVLDTATKEISLKIVDQTARSENKE